MNNLSIIVPILKESQNLENLVLKISQNIPFENYEIIFVDDNSKDGTEEIYFEMKKKIKQLNLIIRKEKPKDLTKSCILGFKHSKFENILVMDGDLQHDPSFIPKLINTYFNQNCDIVIGSRNLFKKKNLGLGLIRLNISKVLIIFLNFLLGKKTSDPMSGFFIFKKEIFINNEKKLYGKGYKILADLIYSNNNIKILDEEIDFDRRTKGKSKMNFKVLLHLILLIFFKFVKK